MEYDARQGILCSATIALQNKSIIRMHMMLNSLVVSPNHIQNYQEDLWQFQKLLVTVVSTISMQIIVEGILNTPKFACFAFGLQIMNALPATFSIFLY